MKAYDTLVEALNDLKSRGYTLDFNCRIFNRFGDVVFQTTDPTQAWDGNYKGKQLTNEVFIYHLELSFEEDEIIERNGSITLIR